jgi:hypothetical protein
MPSDLSDPKEAPRVEQGTGRAKSQPSKEHAASPEQGAPADDPATSTSSDELSASLARVRPDPMLGELDTGISLEEFSRQVATPVEAPRESDGVVPPESDPLANLVVAGSVRAESFNVLSGLDLSTSGETSLPQASRPPGSTSEAVAALDLGAATPSKPRDRGSRFREPADVGEDNEEHHPARGRSWPTIILASYASAVTLGLIWVVWTGRRVREAPETDFLPPADTRPDPGRRAELARRIVAPPPLNADQITKLGQTIRLGQIEVTPLDVSSGPVTLERSLTRKERRPGGKSALKLRLRIRNVSNDVVLAPLDEAFLRERVRAEPDSFIETTEPGTPIPLFPLAVESEWSIVGQEFRELRPGEQFESMVVTAPDALAKVTTEMTWRVRLRSDINHTDDLGVRFNRSEIKNKP